MESSRTEASLAPQVARAAAQLQKERKTDLPLGVLPAHLIWPFLMHLRGSVATAAAASSIQQNYLKNCFSTDKMINDLR
jgi:hypothetical protein